MRRFALGAVLAATLLAAGCGGYAAPVMPPAGIFFADIQAPIDTDAEKTVVGTKSGSSSSMSILGLVAVGDASVSSAARNGGLTEVNHVDYEYFNILFVYQSFKTVVHGE